MREFQNKLGVPTGIGPSNHDLRIEDAGNTLIDYSETLENYLDGSPKLLRAHLMIEELGELLVAMGKNDEEATLDAECDLQYVLDGTVLSNGHGKIMSEAFKRVHAANMTKTGVGYRFRDKGNEWKKPKFGDLLNRCRTSEIEDGGQQQFDFRDSPSS